MTILEALVAVSGIVAVFGVGGYISLKIIQLIRDAIVSRKTPANNNDLIRRLEQYEMRQEQIVKRIQNLETILVDTGKDHQQIPESTGSKTTSEMMGETSDRPLKNKLRS